MWADAKSTFQQALSVFHDQWVKMIPTRFVGIDGSELERLLEHHARAFVMDKLMFALGWSQESSTGGHQNLLTEAFYVAAKNKKSTLFLDYLGYDTVKDLPLMVCESKRFGATPPKYLIKLYLDEKPKALLGSSAEALAVAFNDPSWLKGEWKEHEEQLRSYYDAVVKAHKVPPAVMAIGTGEWLVIIRDPKRVFSGQASPSDFCVVEPFEGEKSGEACVRQFKEIYDLLAFRAVFRTARGLPPEHLPATIKSAQQVEIMRGVRVGYAKLPKLKAGPHPRLEIEPVAFVRSSMSPWLLVESEAPGQELPHVPSQLAGHLADIQDHSDKLMKRIGNALKAAPALVSVEQHYANAPSFSSRPGVTYDHYVEPGMQGFLLVTGTVSHFIRATPRVPQCPRHVWTKCDPVADGRHPKDQALAHPSTAKPKAFFPDGWDHHCAAGVTYNSKSQLIDLNLPGEFGSRSGEEGQPFCEIFEFEHMLCCQTCVFLEVCKAAKLFTLPCFDAAAPEAAPAPAAAVSAS